MRRIAAHFALTPRGFSPWTIVSLDASGVITAIESGRRIDSSYGVEFYAGILIPGMANVHTHLELSHLAGRIAPGGGFAGFAEALRSERAGGTGHDPEGAAAYQDAKIYAEGTSAVGDISNGTLTFALKKKSRIAYRTFVEAYGLRCQSLAALEEVRREALAAGLTAGITPHSTYSLNEGLFASAVTADPSAPLSIHFLESEGERHLFEGRGALHQWYERGGMTTDFTAHYRSPAERIVQMVPSTRKVMLVHNTFVTEAEVDLLQAHFGANLTWVLCPRSNLHITGTLPPAELLRKKGCRIAVGTDSLASNTSLSLIDELRALGGVPLAERLAWATIGGMHALGLDDQAGTLEVGKRPGIVLLERADLSAMELTPESKTRRLA